MRKRANSGDLSVHAIAGTYVVMLGVNVKKNSPLLNGLLGFSIHKRNEATGKEGWIPGFKVFPPQPGHPLPPVGQLVSTQDHPVQGYLWGDYTTSAATQYTYTVVANKGAPHAMTSAAEVKVAITTEQEVGAEHAVFFNRGAAASQAYARKFHSQTPDDVGEEAFKWLSRGLEEAMLAFIAQAKDDRYSLRAAVYEFNFEPVLEAFKAAVDRGVDVAIVYDCKTGEGKPGARNTEAVKKTGLKNNCKQRTKNNSFIAHNKFIVLLKDGEPEQVWTGSTNITEGGIFGHSNVGHAIRDADVAKTFLAYWKELNKDPDAKALRKWADQNSPLPVDLDTPGITPVFSPRGSLKALELYRDAMDAAKEGVFFTAAFGVNPLFQAVLAEDKPYLRYLLLEREDKADPDKPNIELYQRDRENLVSVGSYLSESVLETWIRQRFSEESLTGLNSHVRFIHTKYMLVDPLSDNPIVITGSANFSDASTRKNDENMVVIVGNQRVADIYLGEFMRLFAHYRFRWFAQQDGAAPGAGSQRPFLREDDTWTASYYDPNRSKSLEREMFA